MLCKAPLAKGILEKGIGELHKQELVDIHCKDYVVKTLDAGLINHNYYVADRHHALLFKVCAKSEILPIDRQMVFDLQTELAMLGMAAKPLYLSANSLYYCEQWQTEAKTLLDERHRLMAASNTHSQANSALIPQLAEALYSVHHSYVEAPIIRLSEHFRAYWSHIKSPSLEFQREYSDTLSFCDVYMMEHRSDFVLCHNDLHMGHVAVDSDIIFDWEYAAYGCRYYDIASSALINEFDQNETQILCHEYAKLRDQSPAEVHAAVQNVSRLSQFTCKLWQYTAGPQALNE